MPPRVSVVVLNWNGAGMVLDCLSSVIGQDIAPKEVLVVDNGSADGSAESVKSAFPQVRVVELGLNSGYAGGMNQGIRATGEEFVMLLNFDVVLEPGYLRWCARRLAEDPSLGGVSGKLLRPDDVAPPVIDSTGHLVFRSRRAVDRGELEPDRGQYDSATDVFGVCGAAPVFRRRMLEEIKLDGQYFEEDFFAYFEDFDLCWRARLKNWSFEFVPQAVARHYRGGSGGKASTWILAHNHANRLLVMLRNDHPGAFLRHLPGIAYTELRATLHMLGLRPGALIKAWAKVLRLTPRQYKKRKLIQKNRRVGWRELEPWFTPYRYGVRATLNRAKQRAAS